MANLSNGSILSRFYDEQNASNDFCLGLTVLSDYKEACILWAYAG